MTKITWQFRTETQNESQACLCAVQLESTDWNGMETAAVRAQRTPLAGGRPQASGLLFLIKNNFFNSAKQQHSSQSLLYTKFNIRAIHCHIAIVFSSHSKNMKRPGAREPLEITWFRLQKNKFRTFSLKPNNLSYSIQACGYKINTNPALHSVTASGLSMCIEKVDGPSYGTLSLSSALQQNHKPLSQDKKFSLLLCAFPGAHGNSQRVHSL